MGGAGDNHDNKYFVRVNGTRSDELPLAAKAKLDLPPFMRSETYAIYDHTARRETFTFFASVKDKVSNQENHSKQWLVVNHSGHD